MARLQEREKIREQTKWEPIMIEIKTRPNCWICRKEIREGEIFAGSLKKNIHDICHIGCWKEPENHGWMN